jgi:transcription initiation factor IIF auxiliary subunit
MQREASLANVENENIHREFDLREMQTEDLIRQQQFSYDELMKIKIEKDVVEISANILEKNIQKLLTQNSVNERFYRFFFN